MNKKLVSEQGNPSTGKTSITRSQWGANQKINNGERGAGEKV